MLYQIDSFYYNFRSQVLLLFPGRLYVWKCMSHKTNPFLYFSTLCSNLKRLVHMLLVHQNPVWFEETLRCPIYILLILLFFSLRWQCGVSLLRSWWHTIKLVMYPLVMLDYLVLMTRTAPCFALCLQSLGSTA